MTWVSLEDARAYAAWAGKRLPHEWEWQLAAQGTDGRPYPWGNQWLASNVPTPATGHSMPGPDPVDAHPQGASLYGVMDLVGNVWQWTEEFGDDHTRAAIVRGGEYYQPQGSIWYFPQAYRNDQHGKLLLMSPGYDRSGGVGSPLPGVASLPVAACTNAQGIAFRVRVFRSRENIHLSVSLSEPGVRPKPTPLSMLIPRNFFPE